MMHSTTSAKATGLQSTPFSSGVVALALLVGTLLSGCDSAGDEPETGASPRAAQLVGNYDLVSIQDVTGDITTQPNRTLLAGVPNPVTFNFGNGRTGTVTFVVVGSVAFTSTAYSFDFTIVTQNDGSTQTVKENTTGTWTLDGQELILNDSTEPADEVVSFSLVQGRLTISNAETNLVFQRR